MSLLPAVSSPRSPDGLQYRARSYQLEMLEESLKANIIVAMDTGSGKTHIAVLRIMAELDRCPPEKLVWFLAPTVALCTQQHEVISLHLPAVRIRLLIGSDNVDRWSEQRIWDAALKDVQVVVSTHAVLADALSHGFVRMSKLALLIFDEAHHCARGHPANKIMRDYYHRTKRELGLVPHILGLTASPIIRSEPSELETIEANLDATSITPRLHRQELLKYVHRPAIICLSYFQYDAPSHACTSRVLEDLASIYYQASTATDPHQLKLESETPATGRQKKTLTRESFCAEQLKTFHAKAQHIYEELGAWAADYFITESIEKFRKTVDIGKGVFNGWESSAKTHLLRMLDKMNVHNLPISDVSRVSPKLDRLISFLSENGNRDFSGLVFVKQRATVSVMSALLPIHPKTKKHFRCAPYIGLSNSANRKQNIGKLLDPRAMCDTLDDFRNRCKNLIISTDVLEEGIDITACHMVICFDDIPNLKSFIQRRGRARQEKSTYAIMMASNNSPAKLNSFKELEEEMLQTYQNKLRLQERVSALESIHEEVTDEFRVPSTEALLKAESAIQHLHHFCNTLPRMPYVDLSPNFTFSENKDTHLLNATVILPSCLKSSVRRKSGLGWWRTEHAAMKDAAFQAYVGLYEAKLLTDNLLPFPRQPILEQDTQEDLSSIVEVQAQLNPWLDLSRAWSEPDLYETRVSLGSQGSGKDGELRMILRTPFALPPIWPFTLYWDSETTLTARMENSRRASSNDLDTHTLGLMRDITHTLIRSVHSDYTPDNRKDFVVLFTPEIGQNDYRNWLKVNRGRRLALQEFHLHRKFHSLGLVRTSLLHGIPHIFHDWHEATQAEEAEVQVECIPLTRRRNFLQQGNLSAKAVDLEDQVEENPQKVLLFPANTCTIDFLPFERAKCGLFIPSILHQVEVVMVATRLRQTVLKDVPFTDIGHVLEAITASSAQWVTNYQRYEFVGDSVLKFIVSSQLFADHKDWHEGYLSERRASMVSNTHLARAALHLGLDAFILSKPFTAKKWTPPLISNLENCSAGRRDISSKTLADVVEALIGAAFINTGLSAAATCIQTFLPELSTKSPESLFHEHARNAHRINSLTSAKTEQLIGYQFYDKTVLQEALTHPSCERDSVTESYQRLEFLGDAVLDMIVVSFLSDHKPRRSHGDMTMIKAALVNADLLAFFCMHFSISCDRIDIQQKNNREFREVRMRDQLELWKFMNHHSQEIMAAQQACLGRYQGLLNEIEHFLKRGSSYPWELLARLNADKFFSDMIESILGAIFVDSGGNLADCQRFAERLGLVPYLLRVLAEGINVIHPKTALGHLVVSEKVDYVVGCENCASNLYRCMVKINDVDVIAVGECLTKDEAIVRAADAAVKLISHKKSKIS